MLKRMREKLNNERGLTLVELLAVIVILAIVGAIAFVMIGNIIENSKKDAHVANALQMIESAKLYEANGNEIDGTNGVTAEELQKKDVLDTIYDPWTKDPLTTDQLKGSVVTKSSTGADTVYKVTLNSTNNTKITNTSEATLIKGRDEVFKD